MATRRSPLQTAIGRDSSLRRPQRQRVVSVAEAIVDKPTSPVPQPRLLMRRHGCLIPAISAVIISSYSRSSGWGNPRVPWLQPRGTLPAATMAEIFVVVREKAAVALDNALTKLRPKLHQQREPGDAHITASGAGGWFGRTDRPRDADAALRSTNSTENARRSAGGGLNGVSVRRTRPSVCFSSESLIVRSINESGTHTRSSGEFLPGAVASGRGHAMRSLSRTSASAPCRACRLSWQVTIDTVGGRASRQVFSVPVGRRSPRIVVPVPDCVPGSVAELAVGSVPCFSTPVRAPCTAVVAWLCADASTRRRRGLRARRTPARVMPNRPAGGSGWCLFGAVPAGPPPLSPQSRTTLAAW